MLKTSEELLVSTPADWVPGPPQGTWTYEEYAALPEDGHRYEIMDGVLVMVPAPSLAHQEIVGEIGVSLQTHIKLAGRGRVFMGPVDVELGPKNVYQPDVVVVLNAHLDRITEKNIVGAPDLLVEVASPSTEVMDRIVKYVAYACAGIVEYWFVKSAEKTVEVFVLEGEEYHSLGVFSGKATLPSRAAGDLPVRVEQFFV